MERINHMQGADQYTTANDRVDDAFIAHLDPGEYIDMMFERTYADDGVLYEPFFDETKRLPGTEYGENPTSLIFRHDCVMDWSEADRDCVKAEVEALYRAFFELADKYGSLGDTEEENAKLLPPELLTVWKTYLRSFDSGSFDLERIGNIGDRIKAWHAASDAAHETAKELPEDRYNKIVESVRSNISEEEDDYVYDYRCRLIEQAEQRLGKTHMAYDLVIRAQRLCRLMALHAPERMILYEGRRFAQAYAIHACAKAFMTMIINPVTTECISWEKAGTREYLYF